MDSNPAAPGGAGPERSSDGLSGPLDTIRQEVERAPLATVVTPRPRPAVEELVCSGLEVVRTLGVGGMGVVDLAIQHQLARKVAVKTVRGADPQAARALLQEGWITGALQHPNVVPVYDLGLDRDGRPFLVMKHVDGRTWESLLDEPLALERYGAHDPLEWNLRVLVAMTRAIELAHRHGIVHRDLKPENVMVDPEGQIYVVDWGLAVCVGEDDRGGRWPRARDGEAAGTPAYMAPEVFQGQAATRATDVYLLGGILFRLLTGAPPLRSGLTGMMLSSVCAEWELPDDVPRELATLAADCMRREPPLRPDVVEVRRRLLAYLEAAASRSLSDEALGRLRELERRIRTDAPDRRRLQRIYGEARFGFRQALEAWPGNPDAEAGLRRTIEVMTGHELDQGNTAAAAMLLAQVDGPSIELQERLEALMAEEDEAARTQAGLARLGQQLDPEEGRGARIALIAVLGGIWTLTPLVLDAFGRSAMAVSDFVALSAVCVGLIVALTWYFRRALERTRLNRGLAFALLITLLAQLIGTVVADALRMPVERVVESWLLLYATASAYLTALLDVRLWPMIVGYLAAFGLVLARPELQHVAFSGSSLVLALTALSVWGWGGAR